MYVVYETEMSTCRSCLIGFVFSKHESERQFNLAIDYILIDKIHELDDLAFYKFYNPDDDKGEGEFSISRTTGEIHMVSVVTGDIGSARFKRASEKVHEFWKSGVLPEETQWFA